jgi:hypothetical protein
VETFTKLFGSLLLFVYHCFDRVVINGYLSGLSRPGQVVHFFHNMAGEPAIGKEVLSRRTNEYQAWVEAFARNHAPIEWADKVRKEDYVRPALRRMERAGQHGVYFILKSMEQGQTFRSTVPRFATNDPNYRILARQRSRFTHYYFYIRDETLGPMAMRVASFFPFQTAYYLNGHNFIENELCRKKVSYRKRDNAFLSVSDPEALQAAADRFTSEAIRKRLDYWTLILGPKFFKRERAAMNLRRFYAVSQIEYCRNFIFKRSFPIHKIFERGCEMGLWRMTANKIAEVFGQRVSKKLKGKVNTVVEQIEHGHRIFRAYYRNAFIKQYEKLSTYLRNEACSNNLADFRLKKGLDHLAQVRDRLLEVTDRFAAFQAQWLNAHVDFPLLQQLALPIAVGTAKYPGIEIHSTRMIRLMEVLLHSSTVVSGWTTRQIHQAIMTSFHIGADRYRLNQLRYDLRKLKAHGLLSRDGKRYAYGLTEKGNKVALLFIIFHKQFCGPLANSLFHHQTVPALRPNSKLEAAFHKADHSIQNILQLIEAA